MRIRISSSIANFREKLRKKYPDYQEWGIFSMYEPTLFFGAYHWLDWLRLLVHRGKKTVFWCGSDILAARDSPFWVGLITKTKAEHICENLVEKRMLGDLGISAKVHPMIFDSLDELKPCFIPSKKPHVFMTAHPYVGSYGVGIVESIAPKLKDVTFHIYGVDALNHENIVYHGNVPNEQFNKEIRNYQAAIRLNTFDGFSESLAKSVLLGQYPISRIAYPYMDSFTTNEQLIHLIKGLKHKTKPNIPGYNYWRKILSKPCTA